MLGLTDVAIEAEQRVGPLAIGILHDNGAHAPTLTPACRARYLHRAENHPAVRPEPIGGQLHSRRLRRDAAATASERLRTLSRFNSIST